MAAQYVTLDFTAAAVKIIDPGTDDLVSSCVFQIANLTGSFSGIPRIAVKDVSPPGTTGINCQYINVATGVVSTAGTAITANGEYGVFCPGSRVEIIMTAGTANCTVQHLAGRIF
jgi:hypothetical protein